MRVQKHIDTDNDGLLDDKTNYIYCHQKVCVEQDENGNLKKDYVHGGQYIDQVVMESDSSTSLGSYYLTDLRYSVYAVVDSDGAVTERYRYDVYGKREVMTPNFVVVNSDAETEFGYTGRRHDKEDTGLMYFRARYYNPELGRFVGRDPLGYVDGMSLYRGYFAVNGLDPSGMHCNNCLAIKISCVQAANDAYSTRMAEIEQWAIDEKNSTFAVLEAEYNETIAELDTALNWQIDACNSYYDMNTFSGQVAAAICVGAAQTVHSAATTTALGVMNGAKAGAVVTIAGQKTAYGIAANYTKVNAISTCNTNFNNCMLTYDESDCCDNIA